MYQNTNICKLQAWLLAQIFNVNEVELHRAIMTAHSQVGVTVADVPAETNNRTESVSLDQTFKSEGGSENITFR